MDARDMIREAHVCLRGNDPQAAQVYATLAIAEALADLCDLPPPLPHPTRRLYDDLCDMDEDHGGVDVPLLRFPMRADSKTAPEDAPSGAETPNTNP